MMKMIMMIMTLSSADYDVKK